MCLTSLLFAPYRTFTTLEGTVEMAKGNLYDFLTALGQRESSGNYEAKNNYGFAGRWQFGKPRLYDLGISLDGWHPKDRPQLKNVSWVEFKKDTLLQDMAVIKHVKDLKYRFMRKPYIDYLGKEINGVEITLSGLVAGAHLKGIGGVNEFLEGHDNADAYNTKISEYIQKFGDYNLTD